MVIKMLLTVLLLTVSGAVIAVTLFAVRWNPSRLINQLIFLMGCCLLIWAFGLALTLAAPTAYISSIGRRLAPIGWGLMASVGVHFYLVLTGRKAWLRWWIYPVIYLPSAITIFGFSVLPFFGLNPDTLIQTDFGWVNISQTDGWDWFFYLYSLGFVLLCLWLQQSWGARSTDPKIKAQTKVLSASVVLAAALSAVSDIAAPLMGFRAPQVTAIFMIIPVTAVAYCIKRYALFRPEVADPSEIMLSKTARTSVYRFMSVTAVAISVALLLTKKVYYVEEAWATVGWFSVFWLFSAGVHILINWLKMDDLTKEMLEAVHYSFLIPTACLWFNGLGDLTMWAIVFPMLIFCLVHNHRIMLVTIIVSSLLTQFFNWAYMPQATLHVFGLVYVERVIMITFAMAIAVYVHSVYLRKLRENINHEDQQAIVSEISHEFISAGMLNFEEKVNIALERCGSYIRCDRAYLALFEEDGENIRSSWEWLAPGVASQIKAFEGSLKDMHPMMLKQLHEENVIVLRDAWLLPPMAAKAKKMLAEQKIRALVTLPIKKGEQIVGFLGFNAEQPFRHWNLDSTAFLEIISGIVTDAVIKVDGERELNFIAYHDQLTGLPNRILFQDRLQQAIELAHRKDKMVGVIFIDLDSFKFINDTMGHDLGDQVLVEVARTLTASVRSYDTVARFGGDEFILLINQLSSTEELMGIASQVMEAVHRPINLSGQEFFVTLSAGIARYPHDGVDPELLLKNADTAMYNAKALGKNRYVLCSQDMKDEILERMKLTNLLYRAQERDQLLLYYQPQVDIEGNCIVGLEALLRWNLPERGLVGPVTFIPLAEQTGLIQPIGEWVLQTACRQTKLWQQMGLSNLRIAVNVSVHQLKNPRFSQIVADALAHSGLAPEYLELEITESVTNGNMESIVAILSRLKSLGISISIDDFGTEYSSLSRLKLLPVDRIKVAMQFVQGIECSEKDQAITKVIINLAKSLNLKVIAEGVETAMQMDFLSHKMCDEVQGYFCYRPMQAHEIEAILLKNVLEKQTG